MEISNNSSLNEQIKFFCQPSYCSICESIQWLFGCLSSNLKRIITHKMINYQVAYNTTVDMFPHKKVPSCKLQTQTGYKLQGEEEEVPILDICLGRVTPWSPATGHQPPATSQGLPWPWLLSPGLCGMEHVGTIHWKYGPACLYCFISQRLGFHLNIYI